MIENFYLDIVRGRRKGVCAALIKGILYPLSLVYSFLMTARNFAYDHRLFRSYQPKVPAVISVGNLVLGGSGKTPAVQMLAESLYQNHSLAILNRGYRSSAEKADSPTVLYREKGQILKSQNVGDEAMMHAYRFPEAHVIVNRDRIKSSKIAEEKGVQVMILDDGMQHRKLECHYEIVVINSQDPFGQGHLFPRGLLRESPKALSRADLVLIHHAEDPETYRTVKQKVMKFTSVPCIGTRLKVSGIYDLQGREVETFEGKKAALFCALGNPDSFKKTVQNQGARVAGTYYARDHRSFSADELRRYAAYQQSGGADCLVCTEKDAVKLDSDNTYPIPIYWIEVKMEVIEDQGNWNCFLQEIITRA